MTEINENNKLIAKFMSYEEYSFTNTDWKGKTVYMEKEYLPIEFPDDIWDLHNNDIRWAAIGTMQEELTYHKNWNNLIPVVEKIESLDYKTTLSSTLLHSGEMLHIMGITDNDDNITYWCENGNTKIEAVYKACVEFIKWWNQKQKK